MAYDSILRSFQALFVRTEVRRGVVSIQTFGSFGANFHAHLHALVFDGVFGRDGEFLELTLLDTAAICQVFRRLLLRRLHTPRLSERFADNSSTVLQVISSSGRPLLFSRRGVVRRLRMRFGQPAARKTPRLWPDRPIILRRALPRKGSGTCPALLSTRLRTLAAPAAGYSYPVTFLPVTVAPRQCGPA